MNYTKVNYIKSSPFLINMNKIIAIVGMAGSGKSEAVKSLVEKGYKRVYFGDVVIDETKKRGLEITERNERKIREELRKDYGMGAMASLSIEKIKEFFNSDNVVIESMYSWEEFKIIKDIFGESFKVLAIYTTKEMRYKRVAERKERGLSHDEVFSRDISELENLNKGNPIAFADYMIINDGSLEELKKKVEGLL